MKERLKNWQLLLSSRDEGTYFLMDTKDLLKMKFFVVMTSLCWLWDSTGTDVGSMGRFESGRQRERR